MLKAAAHGRIELQLDLGDEQARGLVALHGCTESASSYSTQTEWGNLGGSAGGYGYPQDRPVERARLLELILKTRDDDGTWNDRVFPRSRNYGTAMVVLALLGDAVPIPQGKP